MKIELTSEQRQDQKKIKAFVDQEILPSADQHDREERVPLELIHKIAKQGYLGALVPEEEGGMGMDMITYGILCEEIGRGSASLISLLTVHGMVIQALLRWGTSSQKAQWLEKLATGEIIGAFGLTEPNIGSDAANVETSAELSEGSYLLNGTKKFISFGQIANLFLIIAQVEGKPSAFLVERENSGFSTVPITGLLGFRSAMLAELHMEGCRIPEENLIGSIGYGFTFVASSALEYGRYCISWGCVGLAQACLEACFRYTSERKQGGVYIKEHQLIQQMITEMIINIKAARLLCYQAGYLKETGNPESFMETAVSKYFASRMVNKVASDAVQVHGGNGCTGDYPVERYFRDAKIMEIIEGSTQIQQGIIAKYGYQSFR